ncbi:MAG: TonB-dependent receptor [Prevotella sp.]
MHRSVITVMLLTCVFRGFAQNDGILGKVYTIDTVMVSGSRSDCILQSTVPQHELRQKDMFTMGISDIADALHRLPGITLRDYGGAGGMKTVSVRGYGAQHTGVVYDGIMLNNSQSGDIDLSRYSLENLESLELVIGDYNDLFIPARQASTASVLTINTIPQLFQENGAHIMAQLSLGSFGYASPAFRYEQNLSSQLAISAFGEYVYAENDYPFTLYNMSQTSRQRRTNSQMKSGHGEINTLWQPNNRQQLKGKIYYYDNDRQLPGQIRYYTNDSWGALHDRNFFAQIQYQQFLSSQWSLKWMNKFNWASTRYHDGKYQDNSMDADYWQREYYTSACILYTPSDFVSIDYSFDYSFNNLNSSIETDKKPFRHSFLQSLSAKFTKNRFTALARLLASVYLNGTENGSSSNDMKRLSPSVSTSYRLLDNKEFFLRASYKNIFRAPTFNENYFYHYGTPDLKPEVTNQLNMGLTFNKGLKKLAFAGTADFYLNTIKDKIVAIPYNMFIWRNVNIGKARIIGMDLVSQISYQLHNKQKLTFASNYSYQQAENRTSSTSPYYNYQIAYIPQHSGSISLGYESPLINLTVHGTGTSNVWSNNEHYAGTQISGYMEWGLMAYHQFKLWGKEISLRGDLDNLFNKQYEIVAGYPMPGIRWKMTLHYQF